ncbi:MAG: TetR/AcrR family transcriptional regulator [Deltaproteobacteria bacterium]|nr:TetR/AcrR family transcriptional regulator [Deltaproteobacteria bacterium]
MSKGNQTREMILSVALAEASTSGLVGISIGGLARAVGLSKSGLYAHFQSKEDLQIQVLRTAGEQFIDSVMAPALREARGEPRVRAMFENWLIWSESDALPGGCLFIAAANEFDDRPGPLRDYLVQSQRDWLDSLATSARIAVDENHFRGDLDVQQFAYDFYAIILAYHQYHRLLRDPKTKVWCREAFEALLSRSRA